MPNTAVKKLKRVSSIIPSFAVRASSNTKCGPTFLGGPRIFFSSWFPRWGPHSGSPILESTNLQGVFSRNACRMREQLCQIDHADPITKMPSRRSLVSVLPRVIRLTLLTSLPGPGRCSACQRDHRRTLPLRQPSDWRRGSQGLVAAAQGVWRTIKVIEIQWIYFSGSRICNRDEFGTPR